ncbi:hypothetical protein LCGC14_1647600, partial [marine sediment metagenome]
MALHGHTPRQRAAIRKRAPAAGRRF